MPQVASDPVVQRPLRPELPASRPEATAGERDSSFGALLDTPAAPPRPQRASRSRSTDRSDRQAPAERTETHASHDSGKHPKAKSGASSAKSKDAPAASAKNAEVADASQPVADDPVPSTEAAAAPTLDFSATIDLTAGVAAGDPQPEKADSTAATTDQGREPSADASAAPADTKTVDVITAVIAAVATPVQAPAAPVEATADPTVAPIAIETTAAPMAADTPRSEIPVMPTNAADIADTGALQTVAEAKPGIPTGQPGSSAEKAVPALAADEVKGTKPPALTGRKNESEKAKAEHANLAQTPNAPPGPDAAKPDANDQAAKPLAAHDAHAQSIDHASATARIAVAQSHSELPANAAAPAQANAAAPNVPFLLAAPASLPLPNLLPIAALRLDPAADNAVPVAGLAVEIVSRAQDGLRRFDIRLDPPELGRIDVRLDVDAGGKVTSRLTVERAETLDLLRRDAPQLERALQHAGLNTEGGLEFSLRDQTFANREQAPRDVPAARLIVPDDEPAAAEAARRGYGRMIGLGGGVDIRV